VTSVKTLPPIATILSMPAHEFDKDEKTHR
jgi:hypothetical protein